MSVGSIVVPFRGLLVSALTVGAAQNAVGVRRWREDQADEEVSDLGQTQGDEVAVAWMLAPCFDQVTVSKAFASIERVMRPLPAGVLPDLLTIGALSGLCVNGQSDLPMGGQ